MAFVASSIKQKIRRIHGQNGHTRIDFVAQFNLLEANGDIDCLLPRVEGYQINTIGPAATDEQVYLDEAAAFADGVVKRPADGKLTFTRTGAAKTNNLIVCGSYWGY